MNKRTYSLRESWSQSSVVNEHIHTDFSMIATKPYSSLHCLTFSLKNTHKQNFATLHRHKKFNCVAASSSFASAEAPRWEPKTAPRNEKREEADGGEREVERETEVVLGGRKVKCEVEVVSWRERRIRAEISVNADVESVWSSLTDYERLADFIPNLVRR